MWSTARSRALLRALSSEPSSAAAFSAALVGEVGVEERELAALSVDDADAPALDGGGGGSGAPASADGGAEVVFRARNKGGGKRGKKGREKGVGRG